MGWKIKCAQCGAILFGDWYEDPGPNYSCRKCRDGTTQKDAELKFLRAENEKLKAKLNVK